jgi:hypothetical protein
MRGTNSYSTCSRADLIAAASRGPGSCKRGFEELSSQPKLGFFHQVLAKDVECQLPRVKGLNSEISVGLWLYRWPSGQSWEVNLGELSHFVACGWESLELRRSWHQPQNADAHPISVGYFFGAVTGHYHTPILTWRKYVSVRKDEQSCFTDGLGESKATCFGPSATAS